MAFLRLVGIKCAKKKHDDYDDNYFFSMIIKVCVLY